MKALLAFNFFFILTYTFSQSPFQKRYGGHGKQSIYSMLSIGDKIVSTGFTSSFGNGRQGFLSFLDKSGKIEKFVTFGGAKTEVIYKVAATKDGGFITVGSTSSFNRKIDVLVVKFTSKGDVEWKSVYGSDLVDIGFDIIQTYDLGYIVVGETNSFTAHDHDAFALKLNPQGDISWACLYGNDKIDYANKVVEVSGGYVIAGETDSYADEGWDIFLTKINNSGEVDWTKTYGGSKDDNQDDLIVNKDKNLVLVGSSESIGSEGRDILFMEISPNDGQIIKARPFGGSQSEEPKTVLQLEDEGYVITGFSNSFNESHTDEDIFIININKHLMPRFSKTFGHLKQDFGWSTVIEGDNIFIGGSTGSFTELSEEQYIYLVKFPNKRQSFTCELSNVQVTVLIQDFILNRIIVKDEELLNQKSDFTQNKEFNLGYKLIEAVDEIEVCKDGEYVEPKNASIFKSSNGL